MGMQLFNKELAPLGANSFLRQLTSIWKGFVVQGTKKKSQKLFPSIKWKISLYKMEEKQSSSDNCLHHQGRYLWSGSIKAAGINPQWQPFFPVTLKAPNKTCSRWHFNFLLLSFEENKAWFFMWILCLAKDSLETSSLNSLKNNEKICMNVVCCSRDWRFKG